MPYFINESKTKIVNEEGEVFTLLENRGGGVDKPVKKKWKEDLSDLDDEPVEKTKKKGKGGRLLPETINKIKVEINAGTPVKEICKKFNVPYGNVFYFKKQMEDRKKDSIFKE